MYIFYVDIHFFGASLMIFLTNTQVSYRDQEQEKKVSTAAARLSTATASLTKRVDIARFL